MASLAIGWPQIIYIVLLSMSLGMSAAKHGERRPDYSFWNAVISAAVTLHLLWWGGFFGP